MGDVVTDLDNQLKKGATPLEESICGASKRYELEDESHRYEIQEIG